MNQIPQISRFACYIPLSLLPTGGLAQPPSLARERVDKKKEDSHPPQIPPPNNKKV